jgi:hypothetical protein
MDMEAMLKKELSGISSEEKSKRIRLCKHDTACCESSSPIPPSTFSPLSASSGGYSESS